MSLEAADVRSALVALSPAMRRALEAAHRLARLDGPLLLSGESGTGKRLIARLVHEASPRAAGPFVPLSAGALPEAALELELFGDARCAGVLESACGGTVSIEAITDLPLAIQVRLVRVLQTREVRRVGETRSRSTDVRLVAATERDLDAELRAGRFRPELRARLMLALAVPPLRERKQDVLPLARRLLAEAGARHGLSFSGFSPQAAQRIVEHDWPGNVHELRAAVEHAAAFSNARRIGLADLPEAVRAARATSAPAGRVETLAELERRHVLGVLESNAGHRKKTAAALGIGVATLFRMLKRYGVNP